MREHAGHVVVYRAYAAIFKANVTAKAAMQLQLRCVNADELMAALHCALDKLARQLRRCTIYVRTARKHTYFHLLQSSCNCGFRVGLKGTMLQQYHTFA
ncbi:hypothetical protein SDC9_164250 [bioreactor metagenome]|uniref:Uncharacterized protein n=1 Tax=bioreactor metagenome TaxID=1076179 RepID=A0A645FYB5_9ZZZZ